MFHCLAIRGRLQRVLVRGLFKDDDRETEADLSDHDSDLERESWRTVCPMSRPDLFSGWASLDNPGLTMDGGEKMEVWCLYVSTRMKFKFPAGNWAT